MLRKKSVLGIDLGTSSVKILQRYEDGTIRKSRRRYVKASPAAWWEAVCDALSEINMQDVEAIGLSAQVGTYLVDDHDVIEWNRDVGTKELEKIKENYDRDDFLREISMPHPDIISYPLPRLSYIKAHYPGVKKICQPKDFICEKLTGNCVTDPYSWRGLANLKTKKYSSFFLDKLDISDQRLPKMTDYAQLAGYTGERPQAGDFAKSVLPAGIPVYVGLNDYFSSLLGMGVQNVGDLFDISGTSEHLGILEASVSMDTKLVSGPYLHEYVHYGVTASSGASLDFGLRLHEKPIMDLDEAVKCQPPIFLPYLNGERAPIWDPNARGMFFGISADCSRECLAYAVMEGVSFSLYHIYEIMGKPPASMMRVAGGAAANPLLNRLKAELFQVPIAIMEETDTSALGAAMVAAIGTGRHADYKEAIARTCHVKNIIEPTGTHQSWLEHRFAIYKKLYPAVKEQFKEL